MLIVSFPDVRPPPVAALLGTDAEKTCLIQKVMGKPTGKSVIERVRVFAAVGRLVYLLLAGVDQSQAPDDGGQTMRSGPYLRASM